MTHNELMAILSTRKGSQFAWIEYVTSLDRNGSAAAKKNGYSVEHISKQNIKIGLIYENEKAESVQPSAFDNGFSYDYKRFLLTHTNGGKYLEFWVKKQKAVYDYSEYVVKKDGKVVSVDLHEIMQPSFFNASNDDANWKHNYKMRRIKIENVTDFR